MIFFRVFVVLVISTSALGQSVRQHTTNSNGWYMYFGDHKFSSKWGVHLEAQFRRHDVITSGQQLLLRTGINYHLTDQTFLTAGYAFIQTYPYGEFPVAAAFPEHRLWQQAQIKSQLRKWEMISRFRLEQRWQYLPVEQTDGSFAPGEAVYQNRFRIFTRFSIPFAGETIEEKSWYVTFYDEVFISFGENVKMNVFDQNRAYVALGYRIPKVGRLEFGYLNQLVLKSNGTQVESNHTLQLGLISNIPFFKQP